MERDSGANDLNLSITFPTKLGAGASITSFSACSLALRIELIASTNCILVLYSTSNSSTSFLISAIVSSVMVLSFLDIYFIRDCLVLSYCCSNVVRSVVCFNSSLEVLSTLPPRLFISPDNCFIFSLAFGAYKSTLFNSLVNLSNSATCL